MKNPLARFSNYEAAGATVHANVDGGGPGNMPQVATCHPIGGEDRRNQVTAHAHAKLFAAAPKMFELLNRVVEDHDEIREHCECHICVEFRAIAATVQKEAA